MTDYEELCEIKAAEIKRLHGVCADYRGELADLTEKAKAFKAYLVKWKVLVEARLSIDSEGNAEYEQAIGRRSALEGCLKKYDEIFHSAKREA